MAAAAVFAVALWWTGARLARFFLQLMAGVDELGSVAPLAFIGVYAAAVVSLIPASLLTIAGGAIFGLGRGVLFSFAGAVLGSTIAFLLGRHVLRGLVAHQLERMPRVAAVDRAVSAQGRRLVFFLRLSPVVPFNVLNYALGLTTISLTDFVVASVGMLPGALLYAYGGKVAGEALVVAGEAAVPHDASYYVLLAVGLGATLIVTRIVTRAARRVVGDV